ncbi:MAG: hypothetical protein HUK01_08500 [Bacteroidaceae bacterium]|nr:hypothetical protein [Bacteroidaceae bacterium]
MKSSALFLSLVALFLNSCAQTDSISLECCYGDSISSLSIDFPENVETFGRSVSLEIRNVVSKMVDQGLDYSAKHDSMEINKSFIANWRAIYPQFAFTRAKEVNNPFAMDIEEFVAKYQMLTSIQIDYINKIVKTCSHSKSDKDLLECLIKINNEICSLVPEYEQERLLRIISVLFYGIQTIHELESEGIMLRTIYNYPELQSPRLKSPAENGNGTSNSYCRSFLSTVWTIAIGEPTPSGEIVASVITIVVAGILLYEVVTCNSQTLSEIDCIEKYNDCIEYYPEWARVNSGGMGYTMCSRCLEFCLAQKQWDCPRPI